MADLEIGWIGLGIMGRPMAANLRRAGFAVTVFNRTRARAVEWAREGGRIADSPAEAAAGRDVVVTMLPDTGDVEAVLFGPRGVVESGHPGQVVIDMSTISPNATRGFAERLRRERSIEMLDAPVTGGESGAQAGTLSILVGGDPEAFNRCRSVFAALGRRITYFGPSGSGQSAKLCNQVMVLGTLLSVCEGLTLGEAMGLDVALLIDALKEGAAGSWQLENLGPKIVARDLAPGFLVRLASKDLRLVLEATADADLVLPGSALVQRLFALVSAAGGDSLGTQALMKALERR